MLTASRPHRDTIALTKSLPIAVSAVCLHGLALSVTFGDTSPKGRGFSSSPKALPLGELAQSA